MADKDADTQSSGSSESDSEVITQNNDEEQKKVAFRQKLQSLLYSSHVVAMFGQRMWEFSIVLFLASLRPKTLLYVSTYGLVNSGVVLIFAPFVGIWIDKHERLTAMRVVLALQEFFVFISAIVSAILIKSDLPDGNMFFFLMACLFVLSSFASLASQGSTITIEKDWVIIMSGGDTLFLSKLNATMKSIDLFCKFMSPTLASVFVSFGSVFVTALLIASWNIFAIAIEYLAMHRIYHLVPAIAEMKVSLKATSPSQSTTTRTQSSSLGRIVRQFLFIAGKPVRQLFQGWSQYRRQTTMPAALALSFLYFTVLSFGSVQSAYMLWAGMSTEALGAVKGVSALLGLLGSILFPRIVRSRGVVVTGTLGSVSQWLCLIPVLVSMLMAPPLVAIVCMSIFVSISRIGLWIFDLSVSQQIQMSVPPTERGAVGGVQASLQSLFTLLSFVIVVVFSDPHLFLIPTTVSFVMVSLSMISYLFYTLRVIDTGAKSKGMAKSDDVEEAGVELRAGKAAESSSSSAPQVVVPTPSHATTTTAAADDTQTIEV